MSTERQPLLSERPQPSPGKDESTVDEVPATRLWLILASTWLGSFLGALDTTIVATLLGRISSDFNQANEASWLGTSYLLSLAAFTPLYGRVSDVVGRRAALLFASSFFFVGTLGCGLAGSLQWFVAARMVAGVGGGGLPSMSSIIGSDLVPLKKRGLVQGFANIFYGSGAALGGPLGGIISERLGWRFAFYLQLPLIALSFTMAASFVTYHKPPQADLRKRLAQIDWVGALFLMIAVGCLTASMSFKANQQLPFSASVVWVPFVVFVGATAAFIITELTVEQPVLRLKVLGQRTSACALLLNFLAAGAAFGLIYTYPLYFEAVYLMPSSQAGARLLPFSLAISAGSLGAGYLMRRTGTYRTQLVTSVSMLVFSLALISSPFATVLPLSSWVNVIPAGLGYGALLTSSLVALIRAADRSDMAISTSMSYLFRYTGQLVGVALSSALLQEVLFKQLHKRITGPDAEEIIERIRKDSASVPELSHKIQEAAVFAYSKATQSVFLLLTSVAFGALLCSLPMQELHLPESFKEEEEARRREAVRDEEA